MYLNTSRDAYTDQECKYIWYRYSLLLSNFVRRVTDI